jgi:hypothetical protein
MFSQVNLSYRAGIMARVECPGCGERVKVPEDGKRLRCPECGKSFRPPDEDEEDEEEEEDRPKKRSKRKAPEKGSSGVKITAIIAGGLVLFALIGLVVVLIVRKGGGDGPAVDQAKVTVDNFKNVKPGMELAEVEGILGGSRSSSEDDMRDAFRQSLGGLEGELAAAFEVGFARLGEGATWRRWEGKNLRAWVAFAKTKEGQRAAFSTALEKTSGGYKRVDGFATFSDWNDLDKMGADRKKEDAVRTDKKWVRGAQARDLVAGEWRDEHINGYTFTRDGKAIEANILSALNDQPPTYRVVDDRYLEIITPSPFAQKPGQPPPPNWINTQPTTRRYEYLVNGDELALIDASPQPIHGLREYYRVPVTAGSAGDTKLVAPLVAELKSTDTVKQQGAIFKLKSLGKNAPTALPALIELLRANDDALSGQAAETIGAMQESAVSAVPALIEQLRDPNSKRVPPAVMALARIGPAAKDALPALRAVAKKTKDGFTRNEAEGAIRDIEGRKP